MATRATSDPSSRPTPTLHLAQQTSVSTINTRPVSSLSASDSFSSVESLQSFRGAHALFAKVHATHGPHAKENPNGGLAHMSTLSEIHEQAARASWDDDLDVESEQRSYSRTHGGVDADDERQSAPLRMLTRTANGGGAGGSHSHRDSLADHARAFTNQIFQPHTLFFQSPIVENWFRDRLLQKALGEWKKLFVALLALVATGLFNDLYFWRDDSDVMGRKVPAAVITIVLIFVTTVFVAVQPRARDRVGSRVRPMAIFCALVTTLGCSWTVYTVVSNHDAMMLTTSASAICFLAINHLISRMLMPLIFLSSWTVTLCYATAALVFRWEEENIVRPIVQIMYVVLANVVLCYGTYSFEIYRRRSFLLRKLHQQERQALREDYEHLMERFTTTETIDLESPAEKALHILKQLTARPDGQFSEAIRHELRKVISLVGQQHFHRPDIERQLGDANLNIDAETEGFIVGLLDDQAAHWEAVDDASSTTSGASAGAAEGGIRAMTPHGPLFLNLPEEEQAQFTSVMRDLDTWDKFDVFDVDALTDGKALLFVGMALFKKYNLLTRCRINPDHLRTLLTAVNQGYRTNPYHNKVHAADVTQTMAYFITAGQLYHSLSDVELLAAFCAAAIHDYDHPGVNNQFLINTRSDLAVLYNDRSVLENHHIAASFHYFLDEQSEVLSYLTPKQYSEFRKTVIELVLATDLGHHFDELSHFKKAVASGEFDVVNEHNDRVLVLKMALKCADVSHTAKPLHIHQRWTERIVEEFFQQGDQEREAGLPISPFMDRNRADIPKAQIGFIDFLVKPMYESWMAFMDVDGDAVPCLSILSTNRAYWAKKARARLASGQLDGIEVDIESDSDSDSGRTASKEEIEMQ